MKCDNIIKILDEYLDAALPPAVTADVGRHLPGCATCRAALRELTTLRQQLAELPVPPIPVEVLERMLTTAVRASAPRIHSGHRFASYRVALATAAVLLLAVGMGLGVQLAGRNPLSTGPEVVLTAQAIELGPTAERVALMFRTSDALHDASISVSLPDDVQITGRPHVRHLSWRTDLKPGANLLELPLFATGTRSGTLVVRLSQGSFVKTLEIPIAVRRSKDPGAALRSGQETRALT